MGPKIAATRSRKTFNLPVTPLELTHIRDLFSILLPPDARQTVSQALAAAEDRAAPEAKLWQKVVNLCQAASLPTGDQAPDFLVAASAMPPVGVYRIAEEKTKTVSGPPTGGITGGSK
jgi:hypothetical protein